MVIHHDLPTATNRIDLRWHIAIGALILFLVGCAVLFGHRTPVASDRILFEGHIYGNFETMPGIPNAVQATPIAHDPLWGPMMKNTQVVVNNHLYDISNCVGEGIPVVDVGPGIIGPYNSLICLAQP